MEQVSVLFSEGIVKLALALLVGALIGAEREFRDKAAGFRTIILICVGATLFTLFSLQIAGDDHDPGRIAAQIVTGVGFLGAGVILHQGGEVRGLTTASTIWLAAALGMGIGAGYLIFSAVATAVVLFVLWVLPMLEGPIERAREARTYQVVCPLSPDKFDRLELMLRQCGLQILKGRLARHGDEMTSIWNVTGPIAAHRRAVQRLLADAEITAFDS